MNSGKFVVQSLLPARFAKSKQMGLSRVGNVQLYPLQQALTEYRSRILFCVSRSHYIVRAEQHWTMQHPSLKHVVIPRSMLWYMSQGYLSVTMGIRSRGNLQQYLAVRADAVPFFQRHFGYLTSQNDVFGGAAHTPLRCLSIHNGPYPNLPLLLLGGPWPSDTRQQTSV